jgi:hypothetical protein
MSSAFARRVTAAADISRLGKVRTYRYARFARPSIGMRSVASSAKQRMLATPRKSFFEDFQNGRRKERLRANISFWLLTVVAFAGIFW